MSIPGLQWGLGWRLEGQGCADGREDFVAALPYPHVFYVLFDPTFEK